MSATIQARQPKADPETAVSIGDVIGVSDSVSPMPLDLLTADDPVRDGYAMSWSYRELLSAALEKIAELLRTIDRQKATISILREELRALHASTDRRGAA